MRYSIYILVGCSIAGPTTPSVGKASPTAEYSAAELKSMLLASHSRIHSLYVEYQSAPGAYSSAEFPEGSYLHNIAAWKSPWFFFEDMAHGHRFLPWEDDPFRIRAFVTRDSWFSEQPLSRSYFGGELKPTDPLPGSMPKELIPVATGIWPLTKRSPPQSDGGPVVIIDIAESGDYARVRDELELCDGQWCHVLEGPKGSAVWLDTTRGCAITRRVAFHAQTGQFLSRIDLSGHREVLPGLWFPRRITQYEDVSGGSDRGAIEILKVRMNDVEDDVFRFEPPPGAVRFESGRLPKQVVPGGLDHLGETIGWMREYVPLDNGRRSHVGVIAVFLCVVGVFCLEAWLLVSRRRRGNKLARK